LQNNVIDVNSFSEQMHFAKKGFVGKLKNVVEEECRFLDKKIDIVNNKILEMENKEEEIVNNIDNRIEQKYLNYIDNLNNRETELINTIESLDNNPFNGLVDNYKKQMEEKSKELINKIFDNNEVLGKNFKYWMHKLNYPLTLGICPRCNKGYMTLQNGKFGKFYSCSNWKYGGCKHIVNLKEVDYDGEVI